MAGLTKKQRRTIKTADNAFTALTALKVIKLTGPSTTHCWICDQKQWQGLPVRKVSGAVHDPDTPQVYIGKGKRAMKLMTVKSTCGIDQCVNPEHLSVSKKEYNPWG